MQVIVLISHKASADSFEYWGWRLEVVTSNMDGSLICIFCVVRLIRLWWAFGNGFTTIKFTPSQKYKLFLQTIEPIFSYGSEVWGTEDGDQLEILHRRFLKEILGVREGQTFTQTRRMCYAGVQAGDMEPGAGQDQQHDPARRGTVSVLLSSSLKQL